MSGAGWVPVQKHQPAPELFNETKGNMPLGAGGAGCRRDFQGAVFRGDFCCLTDGQSLFSLFSFPASLKKENNRHHRHPRALSSMISGTFRVPVAIFQPAPDRHHRHPTCTLAHEPPAAASPGCADCFSPRRPLSGATVPGPRRCFPLAVKCPHLSGLLCLDTYGRTRDTRGQHSVLAYEGHLRRPDH